MANKQISLPAISRFIANAVCIVDIPVGPTYRDITFEATGTGLNVSHIGNIKMFLDDKLVREYANLQRLIDLNAVDDCSADTVNNFTLRFDDTTLDDVGAQRAMGLGTADRQTFRIEMQCAAGLPVDATLKANAFIDTTRRPLGAFLRVANTVFTVSGAGIVEWDKLLKNKVYKQIHFFKADINNVTLLLDGTTEIINASKAVLEKRLKNVRPRARVPLTAKATHLDFVTDGIANDMFVSAGYSDIRFKLDMASGGTFDIVTVSLDGAL